MDASTVDTPSGDNGSGGQRFRNYGPDALQRVKDFYYDNHKNQSFSMAAALRERYIPLRGLKRDVWEVVEEIGGLRDQSDPDLRDVPQLWHFYQTAESLRKKNQPKAMIAAGFVHDLGKILTRELHHWAVVGDTFPVGCAFSDKNVFPEYFQLNPDFDNPRYNTPNGVYTPGVGIENLAMSFGHDEYAHAVLGGSLPPDVAFAMRFHSFYPWHRERAYTHLESAQDRQRLPLVRLFAGSDCYSKDSKPPDVETLKPYYQALVRRFFPGKVQW